MSRALHFFFFASVSLFSINLLHAALSADQIYSLKLVDIDGDTFRTDDGHVTIIVLTTPNNLENAETVGDRVPDYCLGNPTFRMITVVTLKKHTAFVRAFISAMARRRVDAEAERLQVRYKKKKIDRDARQDIFAVLDFDGKIASRLGDLSGTSRLRVFVFSRNGELLRKWSEIPAARDLAAVVK